MAWFNPYGLIFMVLIMIPNIVFAIKCRSGFENTYHNNKAQISEQIGRYGCFITMIFNVPFTAFGFSSDEALAIYLIVNTALTLLYCIIWVIFFNKSCVFRALSLSIIPSAIFLFSGILSRTVLLFISAIIFAPSHILISYKNAAEKNE